MNLLSADDVDFARRFDAGGVLPQDFDHPAHLRLAYIHLCLHGPDRAVLTFRDSLLGFLQHNQIDAAKFHATLTQAWLQAVWYFMCRAGATSDSGDFLQRSVVLRDPKVMLTHYSAQVLFGEEARRKFVPADLDPIPSDGLFPG